MTLNELIKQGNDAIDKWEWHNAYQSWANVLELEPDHAWAKVKLGRILLELGRLDEAEQLLIDDAANHPDRPFALIYLAKISQMREDWFQAENRWEHLLSKSPNNEWALLPYALTLKQLGKLNKAERYCQMDVVMHPNNVKGHLLLIEIAFEKKQFKLAQDRINQFKKEFPKRASAVDKHQQSLSGVINQTQLSSYANFVTLPELKYRFICKNELNYIFVEVPKAGSSSVVANLYSLAHKEDANSKISRNSMADALRYPAKSMNQKFLNQLRSALILENHFIFTFVRNPYTRILSAYLNKIQGSSLENTRRRAVLGFPPHDEEYISFNQFLTRIRDFDINKLDIHFRPQWHLLGLNKLIKYDFIGHLENFESDLNYVLNRISNNNAPNELLSWRGHATNAKDNIEQYYGAEEQALVVEIYRDDFNYLGYGFGLDLR